jgi:hypothetical protein
MTTKLIYHPRPLSDEGLNGFLLKLSTGNQVHTVRKLMDGKKPSSETLMLRLGLQQKIPELQRMFRQQDSAGNRPVWHQRTSRYCPSCLREHAYWRQEWELSLVTLCHRHGSQLVEVCGACNCSLTWNRMDLMSCNCGYDLRLATEVQVGGKESKLIQIIVNKLHGKDSEITYLQPLDIKQLHNLIITLGVYANPEQRPVLRSQKISSLKEAQSLVSIAADVLLNWPKGFYQMLDRIQQFYGADESARLGQRFGRFYSYLYGQHKGREFGFLLHAFENYLEKNWRHALAGRNKRLSGRLRNKHIWVPAITIAKGLGAGLKQITSLIENGEIESSQVTTIKGRTVLCVNRQQLDLIRGLLKDRVDMKMAADILGIQESRVRQLLDHHLLGKVISPQENGSGRWRISRSSLEQILILGSDLPDINSSEFVGKNDLGHALRYWLHKPYLFPRLVIDVIKQELQPIAINSRNSGLKAWVFDDVTLRQWILDQIRGRRDGAMTIPDAAKVLKIKQEVAYHLVRTGLLGIVIEQDSLVRLVELKSLDEFKRTHVLGIELSRQLGTSSRKLAEALKSKYVLPVSGNWIDGGRQNIYRRDKSLVKAMSHLMDLSNTEKQSMGRNK